MSGLLPAAVYGLEVPAGDVMIPAAAEFPAAFRITMAAIDPSVEPEYTGNTDEGAPARATLKLVRQPINSDDDESMEDSDEDDYLEGLINGADPDEANASESDEEEKNGGPSDPSKSKKARRDAALDQLKKALTDDEGDNEMDVDGASGSNGAVTKPGKGKGKDKVNADEEDDSEDDDYEDLEIEEFVLCTLDPEKNYQQPLDITIGENERVFFKVSGTHTIFLTGNYVIPSDEAFNETYDDDSQEDDYDHPLDEAEIGYSEGSDELDDVESPRLIEVKSDEEVAPKLLKNDKQTKKGKNKRTAVDSDDEAFRLDNDVTKTPKLETPITNGEPKLSKKQLKKLKNNAGAAVPASSEKVAKDAVSVDSPNGKKVQFAKNLEQGPSGTVSDTKVQNTADKGGEKGKSAPNPRTVQGVKIDDKKMGTGPAAKKGKRVGMRYIGKLEDGKVFDANKKGKPFTFKLGGGEVIKGWDIGVEGMTVGGERRITIPASLGYGGKSMPGIPANSNLVFDVKLLEIN